MERDIFYVYMSRKFKRDLLKAMLMAYIQQDALTWCRSVDRDKQ